MSQRWRTVRCMCYCFFGSFMINPLGKNYSNNINCPIQPIVLHYYIEVMVSCVSLTLFLIPHRDLQVAVGGQLGNPGVWGRTPMVKVWASLRMTGVASWETCIHIKSNTLLYLEENTLHTPLLLSSPSTLSELLLSGSLKSLSAAHYLNKCLLFRLRTDSCIMH